jgi:hypothetical protein
MGFHGADKPLEAGGERLSLLGVQEVEEVGVVVAEVLTNPAGDVLAFRGEAQLVVVPVGGVPLSGQPAPRLHTCGQAANGALLQPQVPGRVLLRQGTCFRELAQGKHLGHRHVHPAMLVARRVGLEKAPGPHQVPEQSAQFIIRKVRCLSRRRSCVMQLWGLPFSESCIPQLY